jgi:hypothetical protein
MKLNTVDKLIDLKAEGRKSLYLIQVKGLDFIVRPLTFDEYNTVISLEKYLDGATINDTILRICVLYCDYKDGLENFLTHGQAIVPDHIAEKILIISGFEDTSTFLNLLKEKRELAQQAQSLIEIYICTAFHSYKPSDIHQMTLEDQIELFAKAEEATGKPIDFDKILNPNASYPVTDGMQSSEDIHDMLSMESSDDFTEEDIGRMP